MTPTMLRLRLMTRLGLLRPLVALARWSTAEPAAQPSPARVPTRRGRRVPAATN